MEGLFSIVLSAQSWFMSTEVGVCNVCVYVKMVRENTCSIMLLIKVCQMLAVGFSLWHIVVTVAYRFTGIWLSDFLHVFTSKQKFPGELYESFLQNVPNLFLTNSSLLNILQLLLFNNLERSSLVFLEAETLPDQRHSQLGTGH